MLSDILGFLRFATDPTTRATISQVSHVISKSKRNWKKEIKTLKAKFSRDEIYWVDAFVNHLLDELRSTGVSNEKVEKFQIVFFELVNNAFEHGCKFRRKCRVAVRCTYSRWFIRLEIADSGKGFDLEKTLYTLSQASTSDSSQLPHGLQIVKKLTYGLHTNKKGNT
ncbi:MAG: hypothetical protein DRI81_13370 [Chloroflexi bacterium]|nr:MAG: hypothetical protein DRI81_13370 [Chloroflexota bacterium]RLI84320.1 MAG: hypothetical protein DRP01_08160 [Archaeoglobales archaeon]